MEEGFAAERTLKIMDLLDETFALNGVTNLEALGSCINVLLECFMGAGISGKDLEPFVNEFQKLVDASLVLKMVKAEDANDQQSQV